MLNRRTFTYAFALAAAVSTSAFAQAPTGKVTVVTSFSKDVTDPIKKAFEKANPGLVLEVQNRNTNAGVKFVEETRSNNQSDLFWASAPDAFGVLVSKGLLAAYQPKAKGIPERIGRFRVNDVSGKYFGFALSGYGIMWNDRYAKANKLPDPKEWSDLAKPVFHNHVSIASPGRSGTTHLTIEAILQGEGWEKGWGTIKAMAGNFNQIAERSFGVPDAVNSGQVGVGIVIDFFAYSAQGAGFPVKFVYPSISTLVPANVGIISNAPNRAGAEAFVEFLLSPAGQEVLLEPTIRRLPVNSAVYAKAPAGFPNPFKDQRFNSMQDFDTVKSNERTEVVDTLFDQLISFQLEDIKAITRTLHEVDAAIAKKANPAAAKLAGEARALVAAMPISEPEASVDPAIKAAFRGGKDAKTRQAEFEQKWAAFAKENYAKAKTKAEEALKLTR
ncbi:MAG: extracellular solute-binding protein [Proteobacteria bacterium]|nr:extracellular solute-binding protein [Pseudomonadota bacterium]